MDDAPQRNETNPIGLAGFILSLTGFVGCFAFFPLYLLVPLGFIFSLIGVFKRPRGFAIAGLCISALGSCGIVPILLVIPALLIAFGVGGALAGAAGFFGPEFESAFEMGLLGAQIEAYERETGGFPPDLSELDVDQDLTTDAWGNAYIYEPAPDGSSYRLFSAGPDGVPDTADDIDSDASP